MHELALCESIHAIVERAAAGAAVAWVDVRIGSLRQVVPESLVACWEAVSARGALAGSRLRCEVVPAQGVCRTCAAHTTVESVLDLECGGCGGVDLVLRGGTELEVVAIELADDVGGAAAGGYADEACPEAAGAGARRRG
ncbi:MAG: hydrogenase maturation nickel metallochaperone HypA [Tetrasphaera sp.]